MRRQLNNCLVSFSSSALDWIRRKALRYSGLESKRWVVTPYQATQILTLYPNDPAVGSPYGTGNTTWPSLGIQYKRYTSIAGDLTMDAPRRLTAESYAVLGKVYSYRYDSPLKNSTTRVGVQHFSDVSLESVLTPRGGMLR